MLWKECRQQRSNWIAVTILAVLLVEGLLATTNRGNLLVFRLNVVPAIAIVGTIIAYGIISGALLVSSEKEDGTLDFLDNLTGRRASIWRGKLCAGVLLTFSQSLVVAGYFVARGIGVWQVAVFLPPLSLVSLAWGLLGGALCRHTLTAMLTAAAFMAACWALAYPLSLWYPLIIAFELAASLTAAVLARQVFCRNDRQRLIGARKARSASRLRFLTSWQLVFWLVLRQGRWLLLGVAAGAIVLAFTVNLAPFLIWPAGTLILGMACGLVVFCPDQRSGRLFWGAQGLSRGRIWNAKFFAWAAILAGALALTWIVVSGQARAVGTIQSSNNLQYAKHASNSLFEPFSPTTALSSWAGPTIEPERSLNPILFLALWPVYGFCIGLFLGQVMRRPVIALILTVFIAPVVVALWVPSFLIGGLPAWQVMVIPLTLLLTSRLAQRPWISDRLWNARPLAGIVLATILMAGWLASCLWYRVIEVPDVGEPFDVKAFLATLPSEENNKAGKLIRDALAELGQLINVAEERIFRERKRGKPFEETTGIATDGSRDTRRLLDAEFEGNRRFSQDPELARWLDELFEIPWFTGLRKSADLPLGMVQDVRIAQLSVEPLPETQQLARVVELRALQLEAKGDLRGTLSLFETALGVSRQLENNAPLGSYWGGAFLEGVVLRQGLESWLQKVGSDKKLLDAAQVMLRKHVAAGPDPANAIKAEYFVLRDLDPFGGQDKSRFDKTYRRLAEEVPWEKERQRRVFRAITFRALQLVQPPYRHDLFAGNNTLNRFGAAAEGEGLPPATGPGSELSATEWSAFILQSWPVKQSSYQFIEMIAANRAANQQAAQIVLAVRLFQADHGHLPTTLEELVPTYLPALPMHTGLQSQYYLTETEELVVPVFAANLACRSITSGMGSLPFASELVSMSERVQFPDSQPMAGGKMGATMGAAGAGIMMAGGGPAGNPSLPPLMPHAVIQIGNQTRIVPAVSKQ
jgi:hypothetical protein